MKLRWIDTSCFEIVTNQGKRIVTDPYIDECPNHPITADQVGPIDYMVITHTHFDHITQVNHYFQQYRPKIMASPMTAMKLVDGLDLSGQCLYAMENGETLDFGDCAITRLNGHHTIPGRKERHLVRESAILEQVKSIHPQREISPSLIKDGYWDFSNFYFHTADNTRILFWGGSVGHMDICKAKTFRPDILLIQIPSNKAEDIGNFVKAIGAPLVIPHHHDTYLNSKDVPKMMEEYGQIIQTINPNTRFISLLPGTWYTFQKQLEPL